MRLLEQAQLSDVEVYLQKVATELAVWVFPGQALGRVGHVSYESQVTKG